MTRPDTRTHRFADDRGLALGIVSFFSILVIGALLFIMFDPALTDLFATTKAQAETQQAADQIDLAAQFWGLILFFILALAAMFMIAQAVFESTEAR